MFNPFNAWRPIYRPPLAFHIHRPIYKQQFFTCSYFAPSPLECRSNHYHMQREPSVCIPYRYWFLIDFPRFLSDPGHIAVFISLARCGAVLHCEDLNFNSPVSVRDGKPCKRRRNLRYIGRKWRCVWKLFVDWQWKWHNLQTTAVITFLQPHQKKEDARLHPASNRLTTWMLANKTSDDDTECVLDINWVKVIESSDNPQLLNFEYRELQHQFLFAVFAAVCLHLKMAETNRYVHQFL